MPGYSDRLLGPDFDQWIIHRYLATLAQALRVAAATVSDQVNEDDLVVDVISFNEKHEILLTEKCSGGLGQMESIVREIKNDPRLFLDALENAIANCPRQSWAINLNSVIISAYKEYKNGSGILTDSFNEVRNAPNLNILERAKNSLMAAMSNLGLNPNRNNMSAVSMKLLRAGSSTSTDILTFLLNESWRRHSVKIGLEIPIRTFAYLVSSYPPSQRRIIKLMRQAYNETPTVSQIYSIIQQLLFEGCEDSCPDCLNNKNYMNDFGKPARKLALSWLSLEVTQVLVSEETDQWICEARNVLELEGRVCLVSQIDHKALLVKHIVPLFFNELNVHNYRESVHINRIECTGGDIRVTLQIRDFINV